MTNTNRKTGTSFEKRMCNVLFANGWFVHNMAQNAQGQPFDILAAKNGLAIPIDCKVCENDKFPLSRIEENQELAMTLWQKVGNGFGWFALELSDGDIRMIPLPNLKELSRTIKVLNRETICANSITFTDWIWCLP